jgi:glycosyltransferase involved in cell wall biosynthesis
MRVLVVAYYFPPLGGGGVNRTLKLVRGLAASGARTLVLTVDGAAWTRDAGLCAEVPPTTRVLRLPNPDWGRVAAWRDARRHAGAERRPAASAGAGRLRRWLVPDLCAGWSALAAPVAALLAASRAVDVVYTTCPPYSAHAPGLLARRLGLPWVADFRDAWTDCPTRRDLPGWRRALERRMETAVWRRADRVLFASDAARERALRRAPWLAARSETLLTGFDRAEFEAWSHVEPPSGGLELVHAGSVCVNHMERSLDGLLDALRAWRARDPQAVAALRVRLVGAEPGVAERVAAAGLAGPVAVEPRVARRALPGRLRRAHAALVLAEPGRFGGDPIPGKVFDAVGAERPILALTGSGALAELVRRRSLGEALDPRDADGIARVLDGWRRLVLAGQPLPGPPEGARRQLESERAVARMIRALESARGRAGEGHACPSPSAS